MGSCTTYKSHLGSPHPCLRCLLDAEVADDALPSCAQGGVLGPVAGVVGTLQAVEVVKELAGVGSSLSGNPAPVRRRGRVSRPYQPPPPAGLRGHLLRAGGAAEPNLAPRQPAARRA